MKAPLHVANVNLIATISHNPAGTNTIFGAGAWWRHTIATNTTTLVNNPAAIAAIKKAAAPSARVFLNHDTVTRNPIPAPTKMDDPMAPTIAPVVAAESGKRLKADGVMRI